MKKKEKWVPPSELVKYDKYTSFPGRAEELLNNEVSVFANAVVAMMRAEVGAQYALLGALRRAGLLADTEMTADEELRDAMRRAIADAEQVPFEELEPHDYQEHVDRLLALLVSRNLAKG